MKELIESLEIDYREVLVKVIRDLEENNTFNIENIESLELVENFSLDLLSLENPIEVFNTIKDLVKVRISYKKYRRVLDKRIELILLGYRKVKTIGIGKR